MVDDDVAVLQLNARVLLSTGYNVDTAEDGAAAWKALNHHAYDLLITDHQMPRVTGMELIKELRSKDMTLPVILASGVMPTEELAQHPWLRVDATLPKPFTVAEFLDTVEKVLHAAYNVANSAQLFRDCAMLDDKILPDEKRAGAPIRDPINPSHRILVVDDDHVTRQISVDVLVGSGYDVESVKDGAAGWQALQAGNYDLVVTDNKMPNMTGIEMIAKLRSARMAVPVILATGVLPTHEFARRPWLKPDAMLQRPFSNDDLLEKVKEVLRTDDGEDGGKESLLPLYL
jgi:DNA-binding response OmpR family regulator